MSCCYFRQFITILAIAPLWILCCDSTLCAQDAEGQQVSVESTNDSRSGGRYFVRGRAGVVATVHPMASDAGRQAYLSGGNAVDAAIAAALMLGVVDSHNSGLGGGCFILIRTPEEKIWAIDGREMAPAAATREMFQRNGRAVPELSQTGPLAIGVPGALAAYAKAVELAGNRQLAELLTPAADRAIKGHPIDRVMARNLRENLAQIRQFPGTSRILLRPDGSPRPEGDVLIQPDLAATYRAISQHGTRWFYGGPFAQRVEDWMAENGGIITAKDFANYTCKLRDPVTTQYRGLTIVGFPPPSSGGVHVAQMLNMLEGFDLVALRRKHSTDFYHTVAESMKLAFADRAFWLGDSDYVNVPKGLIDPAYAQQLAKQIKMDQVAEVSSYGTPPNATTNVFGKHTTHIAAADENGYWVAITATVNTSFGSKVIVPGTGLVLNNEMDDFSAQPGVPNAFGLIGNENNAVAPGKRPLSSMSPTIVLRDGTPVMTVGAAGGPKIITEVLLAIIRTIDLGEPLNEAIAAPRWHHQWRPDALMVESTFSPTVRRELEALGHDVWILESAGVTQGIQKLDDGAFLGVHDPRVPGRVATFD